MQPLLNSDNQKNYLLVMRPLNLPNIFVRPKMEEVLKRGDVVSLISPKNPKECFVKRVIGLPGDWVRTIRHRHKYVRVPEGHCWIEGYFKDFFFAAAAKKNETQFISYRRQF